MGLGAGASCGAEERPVRLQADPITNAVRVSMIIDLELIFCMMLAPRFLVQIMLLKVDRWLLGKF